MLQLKRCKVRRSLPARNRLQGGVCSWILSPAAEMSSPAPCAVWQALTPIANVAAANRKSSIRLIILPLGLVTIVGLSDVIDAGPHHEPVPWGICLCRLLIYECPKRHPVTRLRPAEVLIW